ncbi:hypothetical protein BO86DRAFT_228458 [Aspergillus japonicus CBS 114.51]|uniref:Uncharacterized protein n=1 Tax=Aspergillus japonicus CBS 114.51 TaxID=1448312 RepID=A0A8T8X958_ASPJA|nr:hypothetical protein BO86DRAFT_228458 [Aspergillus japonicus CBS 114.51]RAH84686.1 hypothetical protein BO86DRAFT_228458 [Aspergillus japonicus CBS 114.51]
MSPTTPAPADQHTHRKPSTIALISVLALLLAVAITRFANPGASTTDPSSQSTTATPPLQPPTWIISVASSAHLSPPQ